jgi:hypothetical protein
MKLNELRQLIREEIQRTQENVELRPDSPQIRDYWSIMVQNQPEDVIDTLVDLTTKGIKYYEEEFLPSTEADIYDSFRDDDEDMDDEDMDDDDF